MVANISNLFNANLIEFGIFSSIKKVSSAYCPIFISLVPIFIPRISCSCFIFCAKGSIARINKYGDQGSPCRHPRPSSKNSEQLPLFITQLCGSLYKLLNKRNPYLTSVAYYLDFGNCNPQLFGTKLFRDQFGVHYQKYGQNKAITCMPVYRKR